MTYFGGLARYPLVEAEMTKSLSTTGFRTPLSTFGVNVEELWYVNTMDA